MIINTQRLIKNIFLGKITFPLRTRILVIIILPVVFYPLLIIYFNKYQDILIRSEFEAIERQGLTFAKTIGMLEEEYGLIQKNEIYSNYLQALLPYDYKNYKLQARLYNLDGNLIADSNRGIYTSNVKIKKLPDVEERFNLENFFNNSVRYLSKVVSQPIDLSSYKYDVNKINFDLTPPEIKEALNGTNIRVLRRDDFGKLVLYVALPVKHLRLIKGAVLISGSSEKIEEELINLESELFKTLGLILFATLALGVYLARSITNPIIDLAKLADFITFNKIIKLDNLPNFPKRNDEIGDLAKSFSTMIKELQSRVNDISSFAADVAHELKNPLTSLRSASETMINLKNKSDQKKLIEIIQKDVRRIDKLISDISFASKLDAELLKVKFKQINLYKLLKAIIDVRATALGYKITLHCEKKNIFVEGNESKLVQVLDNIIDNSISFSGDKAKIDIFLKLIQQKVRLIIEDNGPGFPNSATTKIFDRFYTDRQNVKDFGKHSGLGLSISKQIIEAHKGQIFAENKLDQNKNIIGANIIILLNEFKKINSK